MFGGFCAIVLFLLILGIYSAWTKNLRPIQGWGLALVLLLPLHVASMILSALLSAPFNLNNPYVCSFVLPAALLLLALWRKPREKKNYPNHSMHATPEPASGAASSVHDG